jgi:RNA polymerase sigma-70 factor (ECF subfamily)
VDRREETALAQALLAGEVGAFERFVEHFRCKIFPYSWLMCGSPDDAEEVAQETLLKVFENFDQLREPEWIRSWVFRIAKNVCLMQRRKSVFAAEELPLEIDVPDAGDEAGAAGPDQRTEGRDRPERSRATTTVPGGGITT